MRLVIYKGVRYSSLWPVHTVPIRNIVMSEGTPKSYFKDLKTHAIKKILLAGVKKHQALRVSPLENGKFKLLDGHHTLSAAILAGFQRVPVVFTLHNYLDAKYPKVVWIKDWLRKGEVDTFDHKRLVKDMQEHHKRYIG